MFTKTWPEPLLNLVVGSGCLHIERLTYTTASAGYVTFLIYFWMNFCCDRWLSSVRGHDIERLQNYMVPSSVILSMWQLVQTGGLL